MDERRRRRLVEWGKNAVIVLLLLSALWLVSRPQLYGGQIEEWLSAAFSAGEDGGTAPVVETVDVTQVVRPVRMAAMGEQGRYGTAYDAPGTAALFSATADLLNEALSSAQSPQRVPRQQWEEALSASPGLYFEFAGALPLSVMADLLSNGESGGTLTGTAARLCLCVRQGGVQLLYQDEGDGRYYAAATDVVGGVQLSAAVEGLTANGTQFAFERADCAALAPHTMLPAQTPRPVEYLAADPLTTEENAAAVREQLGFGAQGTASYEVPDGTVYLNGGDTLRLSTGGRVAFTAGEGGSRLPAGSAQGEAAPVETMEAVYLLVQRLVSPWLGEGELHLTRYDAEEDGAVLIEFEYYLSGARVLRGDGTPAVSVTVQGGAVTDLVVCLRSYAAGSAVSAVLPVTQAAAAVSAGAGEGGELLLCYRDLGGSSVSAGWAVTD